MKNAILIATNGFDGTWPAVEYGAWVAQALGSDVVVLGVVEDDGAGDQTTSSSLEDVLQRAEALLAQKRLSYRIDRQHGTSEEVLPQVAQEVDGILVLGPLGRPLLRRMLVGRSIRGLLESIPTPVLYVPRACLPLRKILICIGGLGYEVTAEHLAVRLGAAAGAQATLLHVAPPVDFDYPTARIERDRWRDLESTDSLLGRNLRASRDAAQAAGIIASTSTRQGDVVEQILAEARSGEYDLICMGSPHGLSGLRHLYEPRVTDEVAERAPCPVLTARFERGKSTASR